MARGPRVAAWGFFGIGNLGNEASLAALLTYLEAEHPTAEVCCWAAGPDRVQDEHGVPARQLMAFRSDSRPSRPWTPFLKGVSRVWDVPRTWRMVGGVDVVVVPGTGVLESGLMASPWGMPYWLFLVALACRLRRRPAVLLSVGAERADHPVTRWLNRSTVRLAAHCSYRDGESRDAVRAYDPRGPVGDVVPDLAFALPAPSTSSSGGKRVVVGVIAYDGKPDDPRYGAGVRSTYLDRMTDLVTRLVDGGHAVTLVVGDEHDEPVLQDLERRVRSQRPDATAAVRVSTARTFEALMAGMAGADAVVASRYHNVIAALEVAIPVVSLGYADKNAHLLSLFGLAHHDQPVDDFDVDRVASQVAEVAAAGHAREPALREVLARCRTEVDQQFARFSAEFMLNGDQHVPPHVGPLATLAGQ